VLPGDQLTVTVANGPGLANDWVGLYRAGAPDDARLDWQYLNGLQIPPGGSIPNPTLAFTAPAMPGLYNFRFFSNDSYSPLLASSANLTVLGSLSIGNATVTEGQSGIITAAFTVSLAAASTLPITVNFATASGTATAGSDFAATSGAITFAPGVTTRTMTVDVTGDTTTEPTETFVVNLSAPANAAIAHGQGIGTILDDDIAPTLTNSAAAVPGGATVTVTVANGPGGVADWVGLYPSGAADGAYIAWKYLSGTSTMPPAGLTGATLTFTMPAGGGTYNFRLFSNNSFTKIATSANVTVSGPSIGVGSTATGPGVPLTVTIAGGPGNTTDWVGLYSTGASDTGYIDWQYLNGMHTVPATGASSATLTFTMPPTAGTYNLRFFSNNSMVKIATSVTITVTVVSPAISVNATTVPPGATLTVTVADGPGNATDWVGLHRTDAGDSAYSDWQFLNGTRSVPPAGATGATLTFTMPSVPGTYNLRLFANNSFNKLATSVAVTVQ
jgi:hypothetical protein